MEYAYSNVVARMTEASKSAFESAVRFNQIAVRAQRLLARQQVTALENCVEAGTRQVKLASETRDPKEIMARQAEVAVELGEKLVAVAQESLDIQSQARDELANWFEDGLRAVKAETEAATAKKPAAAKSTRTAKKAA